MRLVRLTANQCWAFVYGDQLVSIDSDDGTRQHLFPTRQQAVEAAERNGLLVTRDGTVTARD